MLTNYLKIALRSLLRQKSYSAINIIGLAICVATFLFALLYVFNECTFDSFHPATERTFRVIRDFHITKERMTTPNISAGMANELRREFPNDIECVTRYNPNQTVFVRVGKREFCEEQRVAFADSSFTSRFSFSFIAGTPHHALLAANYVVLTESTAKKYFGTTDVIGKTLEFRFEEPYSTGRGFIALFVSAVIRDLPSNTSFDFDILIPFAKSEELLKKNLPSTASPVVLWNSGSVETYLHFSKETNIVAIRPALEKRIAEIEELRSGDKERASSTFALQPLNDIHLNISGMESNTLKKGGGDIQQMLIFSSIALCILLIGCSNYINFHTARATLRANEIGIRKTLGASRAALSQQVLFETVLAISLSFFLGFCIVELSLPTFNTIFGARLSLAYTLQNSPLESVCAFVGILVVLTFLCGFYPAIFLSSFAPHTILRTYSTHSKKSGYLRRTLVVLQFSISIILMIGMFVMAQQLEYMRAKNLGFDKENVVMVKIRNEKVGFSIQPIKNAFKQVSGIVAVSACGSKLAADVMGFMIAPKKGEISRLQYGSTVDADYAAAMGLHLVSGSWYSSNPVENIGKIVVNEEEMRHRQLAPKKNDGDENVVVGVIKNFHFASLRDPIQPLTFNYPFWKNEAGIIEQYRPYTYLAVRLVAGDYLPTLKSLEDAWKVHTNNEPFEYSFLDDDLDAMYRTEIKKITLVNILGGIALLISCLGLLGLTAFTVERRTKEIGIRKVLGASVASIIALLSKDFLKLVGIAIVLATPLAYWGMGKWLQDFAYRVELSWWVFASAGAAAVVIAFITVAGQAWRAAQANPVQSLRSE